MFKLLFLLFGTWLCGAVFLASLFIALGIVFGPEGVPTAGMGALLGQFVSVLVAMGATFATFAGLRWVWRGFAKG